MATSTKKVLKVRNDGTAIVSTRNLRRVVIRPSGKVVCELQERYLAEAFVESYNATSGKSRAEVQTYPQVFAKGGA